MNDAENDDMKENTLIVGILAVFSLLAFGCGDSGNSELARPSIEDLESSVDCIREKITHDRLEPCHAEGPGDYRVYLKGMHCGDWAEGETALAKLIGEPDDPEALYLRIWGHGAVINVIINFESGDPPVVSSVYELRRLSDRSFAVRSIRD